MATGTGVVIGGEDEKPWLIWERHWLKEWVNLDIEDKKVLAALYWEELTDQQKDEFHDSEYIELEKMKLKQNAELMADPTKLKKKFLESASPIMDSMIAAATGTAKRKKPDDEYAMREVWSVLKEVIMKANDPAPLMNLKGETIEGQINEILTQVSLQKITIKEAQDYMSLVSAGFNLQELPKLMAKLEALESN